MIGNVNPREERQRPQQANRLIGLNALGGTAYCGTVNDFGDAHA